MKHSIRISVSKGAVNGDIVSCGQANVRERLLRVLMGNKRRLTVIVPGDSVEELAIKEINEGGEIT